MPDIATERVHLAQAEHDIAEGEERIIRQTELVARLQSKGRGTAEAEALLQNFNETLLIWKSHRDLILRVIAGIEHERSRGSGR